MLPSAVCRGDGGHLVLPVASALMKVFVYVYLLGERRARLCKQDKPCLEPASPSSRDTWEVSTRATVISVQRGGGYQQSKAAFNANAIIQVNSDRL